MVIIVLLLAILVPVVTKIRGPISKDLKCKSQLRQIGIALQLYQYDNDGYGPYIGGKEFAKNCKTPEQIVSPYLGHNWSVWNCPADKNKRRKDWSPLLSEPNLPEFMLNISYTWSEPFLRGFYEEHPAAGGTPWQPRPYDSFKGPILADGNRMFNVWNWQKALDRNYELNCLDQSHGWGKYHKVNLLFANSEVKEIVCDEEGLKSLLPW
jgi:hypothetical protein